MEKRKPHYNLELMKSLIGQNMFIITSTASSNAGLDFGYSQQEIKNHVNALDYTCFYKSMTAHFDNTVWQDVYHKKVSLSQTAYIKLQLINEKTVIIQFKQK